VSFRIRFTLTLAAAATLAAVFAAGAWATHSRPGSATPIRAPLVPAYAQCTSPNTTHVLPLPLPSCDPPARVSDILTTGTIGQGSGSVRVTVFCQPPETIPPCTPGDGQEEEDVAVNTSISDVRCQKPAAGCSAPGADYTGSLITQMTLRITDHDGGGTACGGNTGAPPCVVVTTQDSGFGWVTGPGACVPSAGSAGSTCSFSTTLNTITPGFAKERQNEVVSISGLRVTDMGEDGDAGPSCPTGCGNGDETTFLDTGLFLP
jgi:hypothetical protein